MKIGAKITHQKGRCVPLQLQQVVDAETKNLLDARHIRKIDKITDEMLIQPVVITAKKDIGVKIALDARSVNNVILKNKYRMPDLESFMDKRTEIINSKKEGEVLFTSLGMLFAYGQTDLRQNTEPGYSKTWEFSDCWRETTGTYAFNIGFYALPTMPRNSRKYWTTF